METLDYNLRSSDNYKKIDKPNIDELDLGCIDDLGLVGLNPSFFRFMPDAVKLAFSRKLIPQKKDAPGYARTKTARLIIAALVQGGSMTIEEFRRVLYTGLFKTGHELTLKDPEMKSHLSVWALFMSRQYQRFILELFLRCFELGLKSHYRSINEITNFFMESWESSSDYHPGSFDDLLKSEMKALGHPNTANYLIASDIWNNTVHCNHEAFDFIDYKENNEENARAFRMLSRWCLRMVSWMESNEHRHLLDLGGADRISMRWFFDWIWSRKKLPIRELLKEIFSVLIFGQHMRIALARFDGRVQRLRFVLGDTGIVPTSSAISHLAEKQPPWMADRLSAFTNLLCDLSILSINDQGMLALGPASVETQFS